MFSHTKSNGQIHVSTFFQVKAMEGDAQLVAVEREATRAGGRGEGGGGGGGRGVGGHIVLDFFDFSSFGRYLKKSCK